MFDSNVRRTYGGVIRKKEESHVVVVPSLMWVKALDMILDKLRVCGVDFSKVAAISGCAQVQHGDKIDYSVKICHGDTNESMLICCYWCEQQHGTVYWGKGSCDRLRRLDPIKFLHEQFATSFSVTHSPVWVDSSTSKECSVLEEIVGGPHVSIALLSALACVQ